MLKSHLFHLLLSALSILPLRVLQSSGALLGSILWLINSRMAQVSKENIDLCYPLLSEQQKTDLTKRSLRETGKTIMETPFAWASPGAACMQSIISVEGKAELDERRARGQGIIFVIPHLGNWEVINHFLGSHYALTHMYLPNRSPAMEELIQACRSRAGTNFVAAGISGIRSQLQILKAGGVIGAMPDQEPDVHTGKFARFFGQPALTSQLIPGLARRTSAICVVAYCKRLGDGAGFKVILKQVDLGSPDETISIQALNDAVENVVSRIPEQYLWSYKRFRTREDGDKELYHFPDNPVSVLVEKTIIRGLLRITSLLNLASLHLLSALLAGYILLIRGKHLKVTSRNVSICYPQQDDAEKKHLVKTSIREFSKAIFEIGKVWYCNDIHFHSMLLSVEGLENMIEGSAIVMTPPLGNREVVLRYLGQRFNTSEYYHPNSISSFDELIRQQRCSMGIALLDHTRLHRLKLLEKLRDGEVITLCPDQQPRLRSGAFIPFFGVEALTTLTLPYLLRDTYPALVFGIALREEAGFRLHLHPCDYDTGADDKTILLDINRQFEEVVTANRNQYRWSDKRFNIRPQGAEKLYRP
ncbi:MAG: hypothetical protein O6945_09865 [Gammaproteobacteria bacterium]|nr:hypothetical protein [Gammaproteobacteria bacterium]